MPQKCIGGRSSAPDPSGELTEPPAEFEEAALRQVRKGGDGREGMDGKGGKRWGRKGDKEGRETVT